MDTTWLTTGRVAEQLGVSRQHVVNMCDRGELQFTFVGSHRRVPSTEVERITQGASLTREREKSLWLHRAVVGELVRDPDRVIATAAGNLERWKSMHSRTGITSAYLRKWTEVLDSGLDTIIETLTSTTESAADLRQNTPFAGVLDDESRRQVLRSFTEHWRLEHAAA